MWFLHHRSMRLATEWRVATAHTHTIPTTKMVNWAAYVADDCQRQPARLGRISPPGLAAKYPSYPIRMEWVIRKKKKTTCVGFTHDFIANNDDCVLCYLSCPCSRDKRRTPTRRHCTQLTLTFEAILPLQSIVITVGWFGPIVFHLGRFCGWTIVSLERWTFAHRFHWHGNDTAVLGVAIVVRCLWCGSWDDFCWHSWVELVTGKKKQFIFYFSSL